MNAVPLVGSFAAGVAAGAAFLWSLWQSVRGLEGSRRPLLRVLLGTALRFTAVLALFYVLLRLGGWQHAVAAAAGFAACRILVMRWMAPKPTAREPRP